MLLIYVNKIFAFYVYVLLEQKFFQKTNAKYLIYFSKM